MLFKDPQPQQQMLLSSAATCDQPVCVVCELNGGDMGGYRPRLVVTLLSQKQLSVLQSLTPGDLLAPPASVSASSTCNRKLSGLTTQTWPQHGCLADGPEPFRQPLTTPTPPPPMKHSPPKSPTLQFAGLPC